MHVLTLKFMYSLCMVNAYLASHRSDDYNEYLNQARSYAARIELEELRRKVTLL